jgi:hypothetical protein
MHNKLNVVIYGAESTPQKKGNLPTIVELRNASLLMSKQHEGKGELNITIVGFGSHFACRLACGDNGPDEESYIQDSEIIKSYFDEGKDSYVRVKVYPEYIDDITHDRITYDYHTKSGNIIQRFRDSHQVNGISPIISDDFINFRDEEESTLYIIYGDTKMNVYEMMSFFDDFNINNKYFVYSDHNKNLSLVELVQDYCNPTPGKYFAPIYNPWSGAKIESDDKNKKDVQVIIQDMCEVIYHYITYNVHKNAFSADPSRNIDYDENLRVFTSEKDSIALNEKKISEDPFSEIPNERYKKSLPRESKRVDPKFPSWIMNPETLCIKGAMCYYGLHPFIQEATQIITITRSSGHRKLLLNIMISAVSNYCINNELFTISEIENFGMWYNIKTYLAIFDKINEQL